MQYNTTIVSLAVMTTLLVFYFIRRRLALRSTRLFTVMIFCSFFNMCAELSTLYTIYHIDSVASQVNRLCHQLFIGSLDITIYFLFLYVDAKAHNQKRNHLLPFVLKTIPLAVSFIMVVFGRLAYHIGSDARYSYGPMAMTVYSCAALYIIGVVFLLVHHRHAFSYSVWKTILAGVTVWAAIALYQLLNPGALLSSMALMLMMVFLFLSFENPRDFIDHDIDGVMNGAAFSLMLSEYIESGKEFFIITFTLSNDKLLKTSLGYKDVFCILSSLNKNQYDITKEDAYHVKENTLCVLCRNNGSYTALLNRSSGVLPYKTDNGISVSLNYFTGILSVPQYVQTVQEVNEVIDYVSSEGIYRQEDGLLIIDDTVVVQMKRQAAIELLVQKAVEEDGLDVYYQPIYSVQKKRFVSAEALVRLKDTATLGYISPEVFIPIAEKQGIIKKLGTIVFEKVCEFSSLHNLKEKGVEYIEINISAIQGVDEKLPNLFKQIMSKYNISPDFINLEVTESASTVAGEMLVKTMEQLRKLGCRFSMDDFGTGYSNLAKMVNTPFDIIKIDKSLLWPCFSGDIRRRQEACILLESCIRLILKLNMHIVTEGVETEEQRAMLESYEVTYLQGYLFSKPIPESQYITFLDEHVKNL